MKPKASEPCWFSAWRDRRAVLAPVGKTPGEISPAGSVDARVNPTSHFPHWVLGWLLVALAAGFAGLPERLPPAALPLVLAWLAFAAAGACVFHRGVRAWVARLDPKRLVALHLVRFVGAYFLWLHAAGRLPAAFALPGGVGGLVVAAGAVLVLAWPREHRSFPFVLRLWNAAGLLEVLFVVITALRLSLAAPGSLAEFTTLPLSLLPMAFAPLLIASHVALLEHVRRGRAAFAVRPAYEEN